MRTSAMDDALRQTAINAVTYRAAMRWVAAHGQEGAALRIASMVPLTHHRGERRAEILERRPSNCSRPRERCAARAAGGHRRGIYAPGLETWRTASSHPTLRRVPQHPLDANIRCLRGLAGCQRAPVSDDVYQQLISLRRTATSRPTTTGDRRCRRESHVAVPTQHEQLITTICAAAIAENATPSSGEPTAAGSPVRRQVGVGKPTSAASAR